MEAEKVKKKVKLKRTAAENGEASLGAVKSVKKEKKDRKRVKDRCIIFAVDLFMFMFMSMSILPSIFMSVFMSVVFIYI